MSRNYFGFATAFSRRGELRGSCAEALGANSFTFHHTAVVCKKTYRFTSTSVDVNRTGSGAEGGVPCAAGLIDAFLERQLKHRFASTSVDGNRTGIGAAGGVPCTAGLIAAFLERQLMHNTL